MTIIYSQPYIETERFIQNNQQHLENNVKWIHLYQNKIITPKLQFDLDEVLDISYRVLSNKLSFLYLHTNQGVFMYQVIEPPKNLVFAFKELKK